MSCGRAGCGFASSGRGCSCPTWRPTGACSTSWSGPRCGWGLAKTPWSESPSPEWSGRVGQWLREWTPEAPTHTQRAPKPTVPVQGRLRHGPAVLTREVDSAPALEGCPRGQDTGRAWGHSASKAQRVPGLPCHPYHFSSAVTWSQSPAVPGSAGGFTPARHTPCRGPGFERRDRSCESGRGVNRVTSRCLSGVACPTSPIA